MILSNEIIKFANGNTDFYEAALTYFANKEDKTMENAKLMNKAWFAEIERKSGVTREAMASLGEDAWVAHPTVRWAAMAVIDATINAIVPVTIMPEFGIFADFRTQGVGDITKFKIQPRSFYTVSKGGRGERTTMRQKHFARDIVITPEEHIITVYADMYSVLAGKEDIAQFITWAILSLESEMYKDALTALKAGLAAIPVGALNVTGAFDLATLVKMGETIQYRNGGVRPVIVGSATALMNVVPDSSLGYRMNVDGNGGSVDLIKNVMGFDIMRLNNAVDVNGNLVLPDNQIFVVSPSQDKLVKGVMSLALTNTNQFYENADITQNFTYRKLYAFEFASAAYAGVYTIQ